MKYSRVYLVGFMGSGKTTVGTRLARMFNMSFTDTDKMLESREAKKIHELFATHGESKFREMEHELVKNLSSNYDGIVATGGGAPCFHNNMDIMNATGATVYIKMSAKSLFTRLRNAKEVRPLLANKNDEELESYIEQMLAEREKYYNKAHFIVKGENLKPEDIHMMLTYEV